MLKLEAWMSKLSMSRVPNFSGSRILVLSHSHSTMLEIVNIYIVQCSGIVAPYYTTTK